MAEKKTFRTTGHEEVPFSVDDREFVLRRASGAASRKYREASFAGAEMDYETGEDAAKRVTVRRMQAIAGVESVLVAECCFELPSNVKVSQDTVEGWPGEVQKWAFGEVKRISPWLDEKPEGLDDLRKQRDKLDARVKALEAADPKA